MFWHACCITDCATRPTVQRIQRLSHQARPSPKSTGQRVAALEMGGLTFGVLAMNMTRDELLTWAADYAAKNGATLYLGGVGALSITVSSINGIINVDLT